MSKRFKGKTCAYCAMPGASGTGDHVVCRAFFPVEDRDNLPQVPACDRCNGTKSELEHYLTSLMPFGGQHQNAHRALAEMVPARLEKNHKLRAALAMGLKQRFVSFNGSPWQMAGTLPVDGEKLTQYLGLIVRGLAYYHWGFACDAQNYFVKATYLTEKGSAIFERLMSLDASARVVRDLGHGVFHYSGIRSNGHPELTFWRMSLCGAEVAATDGDKRMQTRFSHGFTVPKSIPAAEKFMSLF
jgi:hypothetical protein